MAGEEKRLEELENENAIMMTIIQFLILIIYFKKKLNSFNEIKVRNYTEIHIFIVEYERNERYAGESKYPLKKMISFAWEGITSFTVTPLKSISILGIIISFCSVIALLYTLFAKFGGVTVPGWTSIMCSIWLVGGLQLFCLGVIGEYIGKIYQEVKRRPRYIIADNLLEFEKEIYVLKNNEDINEL